MTSSLFVLLADATISLPLGVALAAVGTIAGGGIVWGVLSSTVKDLGKLLTRVEAQVVKLEAEVVKLRAEVVELKTEVQIMKAVDVAVAEVTAKHPQQQPAMPPRRRDDRAE